MELVFVDTSFLISAVRKSDEMHEKAKTVIDPIFSLVTSEFVFCEFVTFLQSKDGNEIAYEKGMGLLNSDLEIILLSSKEILLAMEFLRKYSGLSLTDASNLEIMQRLNIKKILTFDSDFDRIPDIERIY